MADNDNNKTEPIDVIPPIPAVDDVTAKTGSASIPAAKTVAPAPTQATYVPPRGAAYAPQQAYAPNQQYRGAGAYAAPGSAAPQQPAAPVQTGVPGPSQPAPKQKGSKGGSFLAGCLGVLLGLLLGGVVVGFVATRLFSAYLSTYEVETPAVTQPATTEPSASQPVQVITANSESVDLAEAVAAKCLPSVVGIELYTDYATAYAQMYGYGYGYGYGPYGYGGQDNGQEYDEDDLVYFGLGSGVILSSDGYILTNYHVIEDSQKIIVNVDEDEYEAKVIGYDESSDLAVIKIEPTTALVPMEIGSSSDLAVGQWVMALGSPFGLEKSVSTGIVSALYRSTSMEGSTGLSIYTNMIQTDAAINPGNSGGALVDSQGRLIGINTLIESYSGSSSGVGFAIPVDYAMKVANAIIEGREVEHTWLGVSLGTVDYGVAHNNGLSVDAGAYVAEVVPGSPAEKAGIQKGDVIVSIEKHEIIDSSEVIIEIRSYEPGDTVTLGIVRGDQKLELQATLGSDIQANSVDIEE